MKNICEENIIDDDINVIESFKGSKPNSENIKVFSYQNGDFFLFCAKEADEALHIKSSGGNYMKRDGSAFILDYHTQNSGFLKELQNIISENELYKNDGYYVHINGLPQGVGDKFSVNYENGDTLKIYSNEEKMIPEKAANEFYELFKRKAVSSGYDFTTESSNVKIYDDPDTEFLQGTWEGTHFGCACKVIFEGNHVKIYYDGKLTDDTDYVISEGKIYPDKKDEKGNYINFSYPLTTMRKNNSFTLTAYFKKESYSSISLYRQK